MTEKIFMTDKDCIDFLEQNMYADSETKRNYIVLENLERFSDESSPKEVRDRDEYDKIRIDYREETLDLD